MKRQLPKSFLGKKVFLEEKQAYTIKYQDNRNKDGYHVLLFKDEKPVIFAIMNKDGSFMDAFFVNKKSNSSSKIALNRYNQMVNRKAHLQTTQDDLKDALRNREEAKMKNDHIVKLLIDEHLEDISHGWPSRLLYLQQTEFKSEDSLIITSLREALRNANPHKAFYYLTLHRRDDLLPELIEHLSTPENNLLESIYCYYQTYTTEQEDYLLSYLKLAAKQLPLNDVKVIQSFLSLTYSYDLQYKNHYFKPLFLIFYKRTKKEPTIETKEWLNQLTKHSLLNQAIRSLKKVSS